MFDIKIDTDRKILERIVTGELSTIRSLLLVRELALCVYTYRGFNVLMDMRETESKPEMLDLLQIASTCAKFKTDDDLKIAFLIPDSEGRIRIAQLFKACMETQGFRFRQFFTRESALEWLTE